MDTSGRKPLLKGALRAAVWGIALLLAAGTLVPVATAAPCSGDDCEDVARTRQGAAAPFNVMTILTIRIVDLGEVEATDTTERTAGLSESMAPLLFLTPRVTSILEDVFNDDGQAAAVESDERPTSPVAGADTAPRADDRYDPLPALDNGAVLPQFQRQMYRTDI